jgi:hypothetical protein
MEGEEEETRRAAGGLARWKCGPEAMPMPNPGKQFLRKNSFFSNATAPHTRVPFRFIYGHFYLFVYFPLPLLPFKKPASHGVWDGKVSVAVHRRQARAAEP